jgi:hypothetical protein
MPAFQIFDPHPEIAAVQVAIEDITGSEFVRH